MTFRRVVAVSLIALSIAACSKKDDAPQVPQPSGPVAAVPPPAGKSWTDIVSATPEGGMRIGNPDAPIKLVEYASFTCPHCKHFEDDAAETLLGTYVSSGKLSWEFRSVVIHGPDAAVTLLMNCRGPEPYFQLARQLYATQDQWMQKLIDMPAAEQTRLQSLPTTEQFKALMETTGMYAFFAARGLPRAAADKCLTDQAATDKLTADQTRYSTVDKIASTPTIMINGTVWEAPSATSPLWQQLQPQLANMAK